MQMSIKTQPIRKTNSILQPSADHATKSKPSVRASDDADSVVSSKSDKSRIDFQDKQAARALKPFVSSGGVVGED